MSEAIEIVEENNKTNIVLDMSMWDLFETCKFRYYMRHVLNRGSSVKSAPLDLGSLAHEGLQVYYEELRSGIKYQDRIHKALFRIKEYAANPENSSLDEKDLDKVISAVEQCLDHWRFEDEQLEILEVERPFIYELYSDEWIRILITGKIDLLVNYHLAGSQSHYTRMPIDHKTYARDFEVPRLSNQFQNYCNAVGSNFLLVNRIGLQTSKRPEEKFKRELLSYDPLLLEDWRRNITSGIINELLPCIANQSWRMNFTSCFKFNRRCENYEICETSGAENKKYKIEMLDIIKPWDVTASFEKS